MNQVPTFISRSTEESTIQFTIEDLECRIVIDKPVDWKLSVRDRNESDGLAAFVGSCGPFVEAFRMVSRLVPF